MTSQYFGFEDEEAVDQVDTITKVPPTVMKTPTRAPIPNRMSISEIQTLLGKEDSTVNESTLNSTLNESSFYADEDTSLCRSLLDSTMEESFSVDDSMMSNTSIVDGKPRKIIKARRKRKALESIQNNENQSTESTPARENKKRAPRSAAKNKENQPPKRMKTAKKTVPDENYDDLEEKLNKRFQEIENFKLIVE